MSTSATSQIRTRRDRPLQRRVAVGLLFGLVATFAWLANRADGDAAPDAHPAEAAAHQLGKEVTERLVVRGDAGQYDVWLRSNAPFEKLLERARFVAGNKVTLRGGYLLGPIHVAEHDGSVTTSLSGKPPAALFMSRDLGGSLLIVRGVGKAAGARPWAPPYRPLPLELPHGPVR